MQLHTNAVKQAQFAQCNCCEVTEMRYIFAGRQTLGRQYTWTEVTANQRHDILLHESWLGNNKLI
jgi:hypothetical protein